MQILLLNGENQANYIYLKQQFKGHDCSVTRFGKILPLCQIAFGKFLTVYFIFGKMLSLLWQICDIIGLISIVANGQTLKNNLTI